MLVYFVNLGLTAYFNRLAANRYHELRMRVAEQEGRQIANCSGTSATESKRWRIGNE